MNGAAETGMKRKHILKNSSSKINRSEEASMTDQPKDVLDKALERCEEMVGLFEKMERHREASSNYSKLPKEDNPRGIAKALRLQGEIFRLKMVQLIQKEEYENGNKNKNKNKNKNQTKIDNLFKLSKEKIEESMSKMSKIDDFAGVGEAHFSLGKLYRHFDIEVSKAYFQEAKRLFDFIQDEENSFKSRYELSMIEEYIAENEDRADRIATLRSTRKNEERSIRSFFQKFNVTDDLQNERQVVDVNEKFIKVLGDELGTKPALSDLEVAEALSQIGVEEDGNISFEKFWTWWLEDETKDEEEKRKEDREDNANLERKELEIVHEGEKDSV